MAYQFFPYISFPGNGREALTYYQSIFGGQLYLQDYPESAGEGDSPFPFTPPKGALAHGMLDAASVRITGGDGIGDGSGADLPPLKNGVYSFMIQVDNVDEARELIARFTESGSTVEMPFAQAPWGSYYGQIRDKFGILWAFNAEA